MSKEKGREGIIDIKDTASEINERGEEVAKEGANIEAALSQINLDGLDADDINALEEARSGYGRDFNSEVQEAVTAPTSEVISKGESEVSGLETDRTRIEDTKNKFENISGMSDIGTENASSAASKMEQSATEYTEIINDGKSVLEKAKQDAEKIRSMVEDLF